MSSSGTTTHFSVSDTRARYSRFGMAHAHPPSTHQSTAKPSKTVPASAMVLLVGQAYPTELVITADGELTMWPVGRMGSGTALWTNGVTGAEKVVVRDGHVTAMDAAGTTLWRSKQLYV